MEQQRQTENKQELKTGFIYCIKSPNTDKIYIGATFNNIHKRFYCHKAQYKAFLKDSNYNCCSSKDILKYGSAYIELIKEVQVNNRKELYEYEGKEQRKHTNNLINTSLNNRTLDEKHIYQKNYRNNNKEKVKQYQKKYNMKNKEKVKENVKKYMLKNKDKIKEYKHNHRQQNKEKYKKRDRANYLKSIKNNVMCPVCKIEINERNYKYTHQKGKKHKNNLKLQEEQKAQEVQKIKEIQKDNININCLECSITFKKRNIKRHLKTKKHLENSKTQI